MRTTRNTTARPTCFVCHQSIGVYEKPIYSHTFEKPTTPTPVPRNRWSNEQKKNWFAHKSCIVCKECGTTANATRFECNLPYEIYPYGMKCKCGCIYKNEVKVELITCKVCFMKTR